MKIRNFNFLTLPGNRYLEALPRWVTGKIEAKPLDLRYQAIEAEPLDMRSQAEPGNEGITTIRRFPAWLREILAK